MSRRHHRRPHRVTAGNAKYDAECFARHAHLSKRKRRCLLTGAFGCRRNHTFVRGRRRAGKLRRSWRRGWPDTEKTARYDLRWLYW